MNDLFVGVMTDIPIYEDKVTEYTVQLKKVNLGSFFQTSQGSADYTWSVQDTSSTSSGLTLVPGNIEIDSSTATITLVAAANLTNVSISGMYYTEEGYDKLTLKVRGVAVLDEESGEGYNSTRWTGNLSAGESIELTYVKDVSQSHEDEAYTRFTITCDALTLTETEKELVGYETRSVARRVRSLYVSVDGVARKVKKGYVGVNGVARLFYDVTAFSYSGDYTELGQYEIDGTAYKLYRLTSSGTLTTANTASVWLCGGGGSGAEGTKRDNYTACGGGGGGGGYVASGTLTGGAYTAIVGAAGGATSIGGISAAAGLTGSVADGGGGGSGGGAAGVTQLGVQYYGNGTPGVSQGVTTAPFGLTALYYHSAGGGGGAAWLYPASAYNNPGGRGGSNGVSSSARASSYSTAALGGEKGGGSGAAATESATAGDASFYGGGGGGGSVYEDKVKSGGAGYQGCIYVAVPA